MLKSNEPAQYSTLKFHIGDCVEITHTISEQNTQVFWTGIITDSHFNHDTHAFEYFVEFTQSDGGWYTAADMKVVR